jgi:pimeloyl-ACP methyl ester carboxylesterase
MFPERVSRLIVDCVPNLDHWYYGFLDYKDLADTDKVFGGFIEECFNAKENCALNSVRGGSFSTSADLHSYVLKFIQRLEEEPIPVYLSNTNYGAVTRQTVVSNGIFPAMYAPLQAWPVLAKTLAELMNGNATSAFLHYSSSWQARIFNDDTNKFVPKNDNWKAGSQAPLQGITALTNYTLTLEKQSALVSKYLASAAFNLAAWPLPKTHNFHPRTLQEQPCKTAAPILFLCARYDPVTPLRSARTAFNDFEGAGFVEQKSYGHCSLNVPSLCTAKHVQRYIYQGVLPEENTM